MTVNGDGGPGRDGAVRPVTLAVCMFLGQFAAAFPLRLLPLMLPAFAEAGAVDAGMVGYFASAASVGALTGSLFAARIERALSAPRALAALMALSSVAAVTMVHPSVVTFFVGSFLAGLADGPTPAVGSAALQASAPARLRSSLFSMKMLGGGIGAMGAGLLFPLVAAGGNWAAAVSLAAGVPLGCVGVVAVTRRAWATGAAPAVPRAPVAVRRWAIVAALRAPYPRRLAWTGGLMAVSQGAWYTFFASYLIVDLGRSVVLAGALMSTAAAGIVVSRIALGALADVLRSGARLYALVCAGSFVPWTALALTTPQTPDAVLFAVALLFGSTVGSWVGLQHAELARSTPNREFAEAAASVTFLMFAGLTVSGVAVTVAATILGGLGPCFLGLGAMGLAVGLHQLVKPLRPGAAQEKI